MKNLNGDNRMNKRIRPIPKMKSFGTVILAVVSFAVVKQGSAQPKFIATELLGRPTDKSVTVSAIADRNLEVYFEYGTAPGIYNNRTLTATFAGGTPMRTVIDNLQPNTRYYYRMRYRESGAPQFSTRDERTFVTQRAKGSTFKFVLLADSHLYDKKGIPNMMRVTMQNVLKDQPDFVIDLGDTFGDDHTPNETTQADMVQLHFNFWSYIGMACHSAAFFFCLGNHEGESGYYLLQTPPNNLAVYGTRARKFYYANPVPDGFYTGNTAVENYGLGLPENYYTWEWGDALFVVLDAYRYYTTSAKPRGWDWTLGEAQYKWLKQTLENSQATFKFVFAHHILGESRGAGVVAKYYEWGGYEGNGTTWGFANKRPGWEMPIHQLMAKNRVNIFFQGHDHLFAKEILDGIVYQEVPMPSDSTYKIGMLANADAYTANQIDGSGHLRVTVSPESAQVDYVKAYLPKDEDANHKNGEVAFTYAVHGTTTAVAEKKEIPATFHLEQNYPNPFTAETVIKYKITVAANVQLKLYDILGRELLTLVNQPQQPGNYAVPFDSEKYSIPAGIYFYQLTVGNYHQMQKMLLLE